MFRVSPDRTPSACRDAASQTLPVEVFYNNMGGGSSGSIRSTSTRGETPSTVVRNQQRRLGTNDRRVYDQRRMTESLWSPPPLVHSASGNSPFNSSSTITMGKDGGHLWNRHNARTNNYHHQQQHQKQPQESQMPSSGGTDKSEGRQCYRRDTGTSNEGRTMSSVGVCGWFAWRCAAARLMVFLAQF